MMTNDSQKLPNKQSPNNHRGHSQAHHRSSMHLIVGGNHAELHKILPGRIESIR